MLIYERNFRTENDSNRWVGVTDTTYPKENAQYKNHLIIVTTKHSYEVGSCPTSIGPPILPVIPLFFFCFGNDSDLHLEFMIENLNDKLSMDIQGIRLLKSGDQVVPVWRAHYCTAGEGANSRYCSFSMKDNKIVKTSPIILNAGRFIVSLSYLKIGNPDELTLEFGKISSGEMQINVPSLKLRKSNGIAYIPLMLSGHEPVFR